MTKEGTIKKLLGLVRKLQNEFKVPVILGVYSKHGIIPFGSKNLVKKFRDILKDEPDSDDESWRNTFEQDQDAILEGEKLDEEMDSYFQARGDVLPNRLAADINLMVYNEIHPIVSREILKWHWRQGGTFLTVHYGEPEFKADFWPESWQWESIVKNFSNMKKIDYQGPSNLNLTGFFRLVLKQIFEYLSINPKDYISKEFTEKKRKNRERYRGIHRAPVVQVENAGNEQQEPEEEANGSQENVHNAAVRANSGNSQQFHRDDVDDVRDVFETRDVDDESNALDTRSASDDEGASDLSGVLSRDTVELRTATSDGNGNDSDISDVISREILDAIEEEVGAAEVLEQAISSDDIMSPINTSPVFSRKRKLPQNTEHETLAPSLNPFRVFRKGPSELNHQRIPCKEPRIRLEVSNEADPIRNIGNCQTPHRTRSSSRLPRNESQNAATGTSDSLANLTDIEIVSDVVEAFKELSELNTSANPKKETGGLLFGRRVENRFIIDTLLIPKQNGYDTYFETTSGYEILLV